MPSSPGAGPGYSPPSRGRRIAFKLAALAIPFLLLGAVELALRLSGFGYPTAFFIPDRNQRGAVLVENQRFSLRYFPPELARTPLSLALAHPKPQSLCRIFVLGESAAMGDPEPAYGFSRMLEILLRARFPNRQIEVVNVAVTAINSHVVREIARDCAQAGGDIWILYMGNNEVVGPFGAGTIFGSQVPPLPVIRANLALKTTRLGQAADQLKAKLSPSGTLPKEWEGMEMFLHQKVPADDPRLARVYDHFEANLDAIFKIASTEGIRVLACTVAANLRDCAPFASAHLPGLSPDRLAEWDRLFKAGVAAQEAANFPVALAAFEAASKIDSSHAELQFRLGHVRLAMGNSAAARPHLERARDLDALRFRVDAPLNQRILKIAFRHAGNVVKPVDAAALLAGTSPDGLPGTNYFLEHVHLNMEGNYAIARLLAEQAALWVAPDQKSPPPDSPEAGWLPLGELLSRLGLTEWDRLQLTDEMLKRFRQPPFTFQAGHEARLRHWETIRAGLQSSLLPAALPQAQAVYRNAIAASPDDCVLKERYARLLHAFGDPAGAEAQWRAVIAAWPHYADAWYGLGNVLEAQGKTAEALECYQSALRRKPGSAEARNGLGLAYADQGNVEAAIREYETALRKRPEFTEARINLGQLLIQAGRQQEAIEQLRTALKYDSNSFPAHINLGKALAGLGSFDEALAHYHAAAALRPASALAQFNMGNVYAQKKDPRALAHFEQASRLDPQFFEARYHYGLQLGQAGRLQESIDALNQAVRLRPDFADARFNLGVALAKSGRLAEAVKEFEETLRLQPGHPHAAQAAEKARAIQQRTPPR